MRGSPVEFAPRHDRTTEIVRDTRDPRFLGDHWNDPEYSLVTRSSDGQMLFLDNKLSR